MSGLFSISVGYLFILKIVSSVVSEDPWTSSEHLENNVGRLSPLVSSAFRNSEPHNSIRIAHKRLISRSKIRSDRAADSEKQWLVKVRGPVESALRLGMEAVLETNLTNYIPDDGFIFLARRSVAQRLLRISGVLGVAELSLDSKISPQFFQFDLKQMLRKTDRSSSSGSLVLLVDIEPWKSEVELEIAMQSWRLELGLLTLNATLSVSSTRRLLVNVLDHSQGHEALAWLATQPRVLWIGKKPEYRVNNKFATGILQSGKAVDLRRHPFWDASIQGQGEIIAIADTVCLSLLQPTTVTRSIQGLDYDHCMFSDASTLPTFDRTANKHRKICHIQIYSNFNCIKRPSSRWISSASSIW